MKGYILCTALGLASLILLAYVYIHNLLDQRALRYPFFFPHHHLDNSSTTVVRRRNLTVAFTGRLGNHLFIYAALLAIARRHDCEATLQTHDKASINETFVISDIREITVKQVVENYTVFKEFWGVGYYDETTENADTMGRLTGQKVVECTKEVEVA